MSRQTTGLSRGGLRAQVTLCYLAPSRPGRRRGWARARCVGDERERAEGPAGEADGAAERESRRPPYGESVRRCRSSGVSSRREMPLLSVRNLTRTFGVILAVDRVC